MCVKTAEVKEYCHIMIDVKPGPKRPYKYKIYAGPKPEVKNVQKTN